MLQEKAITAPAKKLYVKPALITHGSVQQLTEGGRCEHHESHDCGSSIKRPCDWGLSGKW